MARKLRVEYEGAIYHVMNRGGSVPKIDDSAGVSRAVRVARTLRLEAIRVRSLQSTICLPPYETLINLSAMARALRIERPGSGCHLPAREGTNTVHLAVHMIQAMAPVG